MFHLEIVKTIVIVSDIYAKNFPLITSYNLHGTPGIRCYYSHFIIEARLFILPVLVEIK